MGAIFSNGLALPAAATFIAALRKNWFWILFFSSLFVGIETLFLKLSIYSHNWWRTEFTGMGLFLFYFPICKALHELIMQPLHGFYHFLLLFLVIGPIAGTIHILPIMVFSNRFYELGWYENVSQDTNALAAIYYLCMSVIITILAKLRWKYKWTKYVLITICTCTVTMVLYFSGILHSIAWWDPFYYILVPNLFLMMTAVISKRLSIGPDNVVTS